MLSSYHFQTTQTLKTLKNLEQQTRRRRQQMRNAFYQSHMALEHEDSIGQHNRIRSLMTQEQMTAHGDADDILEEGKDQHANDTSISGLHDLHSSRNVTSFQF